MKKIGLLWLHNDLRICDNATLSKASQSCDELLVMTATYDFPSHRGQPYHVGKRGRARTQFFRETLTDLDAGLHQFGNRLVFLENISLKSLCQFIADYAVTDVFYSHTADYDQNLRRELVNKYVPNIEWHGYHSSTLFTEQPNLPTVFTQFRKEIEEKQHFLQRDYDCQIAGMPIQLPSVPKHIDSQFWFASTASLSANQSDKFIGGETHALMHLDRYFNSDAPRTYKETRNELDDWSLSTKFSAWLANGSLSVNTLINRLRKYECDVEANESTYWIWFELLWREYFHWYAIKHGYKLFSINGIGTNRRAPCFYPERYERWKNGNTPYPIVNACMSQLRETGYMSNRGRQLVASCFVHELGMDWRYGATYFEQQLVDYDVASNWSNWQYIAGVGADPRSGRQFNLAKQTKQYDPNGKFIDKWNGDVGETQIDSVDASDWPIG